MQPRAESKRPYTPNPEHTFEERWSLAQKRYKGTINTFARNTINQLRGWAIEDIEQELLMVLWRCVNNYDPNKGASFNTLFQGSAKNCCISLIRTAHTQMRAGDFIAAALDTEAVAAEVDAWYGGSISVEDQALVNLELAEVIQKYGPGILEGKPGPKPKRQAVA